MTTIFSAPPPLPQLSQKRKLSQKELKSVSFIILLMFIFTRVKSFYRVTKVLNISSFTQQSYCFIFLEIFFETWYHFSASFILKSVRISLNVNNSRIPLPVLCFESPTTETHHCWRDICSAMAVNIPDLHRR